MNEMQNPPPDPTEAPQEPAQAAASEGADGLPKDAPLGPRLRDVLEAILFASHKPVSTREFVGILRGAAQSGDPQAQAFAKVKEAQVLEALQALAAERQEPTCVYHLRETAGGWQLASRPEFYPWLRQLFPENRPARLSPPALETLAIIAYRQPVTRADIEAVRGVSVDGVMQTLLDRGLIRIAGRAEIPGRPLLYETTQFFLDHFGIRSLEELPNAAELRRPAAASQAPHEEQPSLPLQNSPPATADEPAAGQQPAGGAAAADSDEAPPQ